MNKNINLFGNQSESSRIDRIKQGTINKVKSSYPNGYLVKNETEQNSRITALSRVRGSGYIVPKKVTYYGGRKTSPEIPKNVTLTVISTSEISVSFTSPSVNTTVYTVISNLGDIETGTSSPITVSGLLSNTEYTFTVSATNIFGASSSSIASSSAITKPDAPTIGSSTVLSSTAVSVAFTAPSGTGSLTYTVTSSPGGLTGIGASSPITVSGLTANTAYTFSVTATNSSGTSIASSSVSRDFGSIFGNIVTTTPSSPTIVNATVVSANVVNIYFIEQIGTGIITQYTVSSNLGDIATGASSPISVSGLISNTSYIFTMTATNSGGISLPSIESNTVITLLSVPNAPIIGQATIINGNEISISFISSGTGITGYTVTSSPGGFIGTGTSSPISIIGLPSNTYTFTVTATNSDGISLPSGESNTVTTIIEPPTIGIVTVLGTTDVSVEFIASNEIGNFPYTYTVISIPDGLMGTGTSSPIIVSGLSSNTEYTFTVTATSIIGSESSGESSLITTKPDSPIIDSTTVLSSTEVSVEFTAPSGTSSLNYTVISIPEGLMGTGTSSPITVSGLSSNTEYTFSISATNSGGTSSSSLSSLVTTKPEPPINCIATVSGSTIVSVAFTAPSGTGTITGYIVTSNLGDIATGTSSPINVIGLTANTSYTFTVSATNSGGTSFASSSSASITTQISAPTINNLMVLSNTDISVGFTPPNEGDGIITGYTVTSSPGGLIGTGTSSPITVSGLTSNTEYTFTVSAIRHIISRRPIVLSVSSVSSSISTISDPPTLGIVTVSDKTSVSIAFTPPSGSGIITSYTVTSSPGGLTGTGTSSPITITGLTTYESYIFTVSATNSGGTSIQSGASSYISPY
jgi:hypothetical protein